jgi:nucleolar protein 4
LCQITADDLRALFTPHGAIHSVHIPTVPHQPDHDAPSRSTPPTTTKKPLARGFAFVWFLSKQDAARAISRVNGAKVYGGYAADKAIAAANKIAGRKEISKKKNEENARVIAVDWALSKDKWKEVNPSGENAEGDDEGSILKIHSGDEEEEEKYEDGKESSSTSQDEEDGDDVDDDAIRGSATSDQTGHPPPPAEGTTLFIRNVPFEATDDDLKELSV